MAGEVRLMNMPIEKLWGNNETARARMTEIQQMAADGFTEAH